MKFKTTKEISLTIFFAVLYVVGVVILAPISFNIFQVRVADALLPLAIIFGWPIIIGISIGTIVANIYGGLGGIDIIGGTIANFIATFLAWKIGLKAFKGSWFCAVGLEVLVITSIVGGYLSYLFAMPLSLALIGVFLGSLIAIGVLGYVLLTALSRQWIIKTLQSYGIKVYLKK